MPKTTPNEHSARETKEIRTKDKKLIDLGNRLRIFLLDHFGSISEAARQMNKQVSAFQPYLRGKSIPGGEILSELGEFTLNLNWLVLGTGNMTTNEQEIRLKGLTQIKIPTVEGEPIIDVIYSDSVSKINERCYVITTEDKSMIYVMDTKARQAIEDIAAIINASMIQTPKKGSRSKMGRTNTTITKTAITTSSSKQSNRKKSE